MTIESSSYPSLIVANGTFPTHRIPLEILHRAKHIIACDGAVSALLEAGIEPSFIVGDIDSLDPELEKRFADRLFRNSDQETNDLTKAVAFAVEKGFSCLAILGATGKREDHCLGNISLLAQYCKQVEVSMFTDYGVFVSINASTRLESFKGQQVSIFSLSPETPITSSGLVYALDHKKLKSWWQGTLNEAEGSHFTLAFDRADLLVFRSYEPKEK